MSILSNKWFNYSAALVILVVAAVIAGLTASPRHEVSTIAIGPASLILTAPSAGTVDVGQLQHVNWISSGYTAPTVSINIIRKVSDNPAKYELVRTVATATKDDGDAVWVPALIDVGSNTFVEVGCALTNQACTASAPTLAMAVVNTGAYANTANAYQAIEQLNNK